MKNCKWRPMRFGALCAALMLVVGCRSRATPAGYFGPTQTMAEVVGEINSNSTQIPTLWARMDYFEVTFVQDGKSDTVNGDQGTLMFRRPRDLRVTAQRPGATIFNIGSNGDVFWVISPPPGADTVWWGHYKNLGKPCIKEDIPVRPDLLTEVLGIAQFETDFLHPPMPAMRFNNDSDAYMFTWNAPARSGSPRLIAVKEIWYDRQTKNPTLVLLFDEDGRVVLRAYLSKHEPVAIDGVEREKWPRVAREYKLFFPTNGSKFWFTLKDMALEYKKAPNDRSFRFDPQTAGVTKEIAIDQGCAD